MLYVKKDLKDGECHLIFYVLLKTVIVCSKWWDFFFFFFLSGFSFTNIHDSRDCRGRGRVSI